MAGNENDRSSPEVELINLTPHVIRIFLAAPERTVMIQPSGQLARVKMRQHKRSPVLGIPVMVTTHGDIHGLPEPEPGKVYIVSNLVARLVGSDRVDVLAPDISHTAIRDENNRILGVRRLQQFV